MRLFIGLDVSLAKTAICVISEHDKIVREAEIAGEPEVFSRWLGYLDGPSIGLDGGQIIRMPDPPPSHER